MLANRFTSLSDEELQALLEDRDSSKTYHKKNKKTNIYKNNKNILFIKKTYI
jgi:hypothetical protein